MNTSNFKEIGKVFETDKYDVFKIMAGNRNIKSEIVDVLKEDIKRHGQVAPIIVNEYMEVIDGQFRLTATSELGMPVKFIISPGLTIEHVRGTNAVNNAWSLLDHLKSRVDLGDERYIKIQELMDRYSLSLIVVLSVLAGKITDSNNRKTSVSYAFKRDMPTINKTWEEAEKECELVHDFKRFMIKAFPRRSVQHAILSIIRKENYNHERMMEQLEQHANKVDLKTYYNLDTRIYLNEVYNYRKFRQNIINLLTERELLQAAKNKR